MLLSEGGRITLTKMEIILKNSFAFSNVVVRFLEMSSCLTSGVPRNFFRGGSTNSVEDRENGDLWVVAP